jgi:hypothetical protein
MGAGSINFFARERGRDCQPGPVRTQWTSRVFDNAALMSFTRSLGKAASWDGIRVVGSTPARSALTAVKHSCAPALSVSSEIRSGGRSTKQACRLVAQLPRRRLPMPSPSSLRHGRATQQAPS